MFPDIDTSNGKIATTIISHKEAGSKELKLGTPGKEDPDDWFNENGYSMDGFRQDVKNMVK